MRRLSSKIKSITFCPSSHDRDYTAKVGEEWQGILIHDILERDLGLFDFLTLVSDTENRIFFTLNCGNCFHTIERIQV